jgi:beta-galactosidase
LGLGSRIADNLPTVVRNAEAGNFLEAFPVRFANHIPGLLMKTMQSGNSLITIIINKSGRTQEVPLVFKKANLQQIFCLSIRVLKFSMGLVDIKINPERNVGNEWNLIFNQFYYAFGKKFFENYTRILFFNSYLFDLQGKIRNTIL